MKLAIKLVLLVIAAGFLLLWPAEDNRNRDISITTIQTTRDSSEDPVIKLEAMVRDRRNWSTLPDPDEMRRQRDVARTANMDWIVESTRNNSPESWDLLMQYDKLPLSVAAKDIDSSIVSLHKDLGTFQYLRGRTRLDFLASMETNVHEVAHAYFDQKAIHYILDHKLAMNIDNVNGFIYLSPSTVFFLDFPLKSLFPSNKLMAVIPKNLQTFRFDTYIDGTTSTQSEGVIGLLNELYAYYVGSRYCYDMLEPYKTAAGSDASGLFEWISRTESTMTAFYEFDFFISEYLLYMKENYRDDYERLKSDKSFPEAYRTTYNLYKELVDKYQLRIKNEIRSLNAQGRAVARSEKGWVWIKPEKSNVSSGTPVFSEEKDKLVSILGSRRYRDIDSDFNIR